ncbi:hypothetical protein GCM10022221_20380 [Actinocorallia aurea]
MGPVDTTPYARRLLELLACFGPAPVPYALVLRPAILRDFPGFTDITGDTLWSALSALDDVDLLTPSAPDTRVPLLRLTTEGANTPAPDSGALHRAARALLVRAADALGEPERASAWPLWCALSPHVFNALRTAGRDGDAGETDEGMVRAAPRCLRGLNAAGLFRVAESRGRACLEVLEPRLPDGHPDVVAVRREIAAALAGRGLWIDAEAAYWEILDAGAYHPGDPDGLAARRGIAAALAGQGRHGAAEDMYRALFDDHLRTYGPEAPTTMAVLRGEAGALAGQGRYVEAEEAFREVWHTELLTVGPGHPDTLATYHGVVSAISGQERYEEAEPAFRRLLGERSAVLGPDHPDTLDTRFELALVILLLGRAEEARAEIRSVLAARIDVLGSRHPLVEATRAHLA